MAPTTSQVMFGIRPKRNFRLLLSIPAGTEMFHFPACAPAYTGYWPTSVGFPHSDISESKVDWHLVEAYRSHSTSFIALVSQGIHHTPLHSHRECCTPLCLLSQASSTIFWVRTCIPASTCVFVFIGVYPAPLKKGWDEKTRVDLTLLGSNPDKLPVALNLKNSKLAYGRRFP